MTSDSEEQERSGSGNGKEPATGNGSGNGHMTQTETASGTKTGSDEPDASKGRSKSGADEPEAWMGDPSAEEIADLQKMTLQPALERLQWLCFVLGITYSKKVLEMGVTSHEELDLERVQKQIDELEKTLVANYKRIKDIGLQLLTEWQISETPFKRMMTFSHIISVYDSASPSDVQDADFLSTLYLKRAQKELTALKSERLKEAKKEYQMEKKKLEEMVKENHFTWKSVGFDHTREADPDKYTEELAELRESIRKAKKLAAGRRELIFRIERVRQLIEQKKLPCNTIKAFLHNAEEYVDSKVGDTLEIMYDGENIYVLLEKFRKCIVDLEKDRKMRHEKELLRATVRTRDRFRKVSNPSDVASANGEDGTGEVTKPQPEGKADAAEKPKEVEAKADTAQGN